MIVNRWTSKESATKHRLTYVENDQGKFEQNVTNRRRMWSNMVPVTFISFYTKRLNP